MHETGCLGLVYWDDPEGWNGEGDGRGADSSQCMAKPIQYCKVKKNNNNKTRCNKIKKKEPRTCSFNIESICLPTICKKKKKKTQEKLTYTLPALHSRVYETVWNC